MQCGKVLILFGLNLDNDFSENNLKSKLCPNFISDADRVKTAALGS